MAHGHAITDALADLQEAIIGGRSLAEAAPEIAADHGVRPEVLIARASRKGGLIENVSKLREQAELVKHLNEFERQGLLFGYPRPVFSEWYAERTGSALNSTQAASAQQDLKLRVERAQQRNHQRCLMEISRNRPEADD